LLCYVDSVTLKEHCCDSSDSEDRLVLCMVDVVQVNNEPAVINESLHRSPFYHGHTTYGGRAAYRYSGHATPYKVSDILSSSLFFCHRHHSLSGSYKLLYKRCV